MRSGNSSSPRTLDRDGPAGAEGVWREAYRAPIGHVKRNPASRGARPEKMNRASELWIRAMERVTGIEPALSAWESGPSRALTCPELPSWLSASDREIPVLTGLNGTLMARRSWTAPCLLGHGQVILFYQRAEVNCSYWRPMEGGEVNRMPGTGWVGWPGSRSCRRCQQPGRRRRSPMRGRAAKCALL